jgi:hypothetical protein
MIILFTLALALALPLVTWILRRSARAREPVVVFTGTYSEAVRMKERLETGHIPAEVHLIAAPPHGHASVFVERHREHDARRLISAAGDMPPEAG